MNRTCAKTSPCIIDLASQREDYHNHSAEETDRVFQWQMLIADRECDRFEASVPGNLPDHCCVRGSFLLIEQGRTDYPCLPGSCLSEAITFRAWPSPLASSPSSLAIPRSFRNPPGIHAPLTLLLPVEAPFYKAHRSPYKPVFDHLRQQFYL